MRLSPKRGLVVLEVLATAVLVTILTVLAVPRLTHHRRDEQEIAPPAFAQDGLETFADDFATGAVTVWQSDNTSTLHYQVWAPDASGTPSLYCLIHSPGGHQQWLFATGTAWCQGRSEAYFNFSGPEHGVYRATCFWRIDFTGTIDGNHALTTVAFTR